VKVGDLVRVVCVDGWPMGMVLEVRENHPSGYRIQHYLVQLFGRPSARNDAPHQYLRHHLEIIQ
jgi:hypothetical protein